MAKPTGALLSFGASGTIAKTAVFASWRGRQYVRRHVIPANPNSSGQQLTRNTFKWLQQVWKLSPTLFQDPWTAYAKGQPLINRNAFGKSNIGALRSQTDLSAFVFSPGAGGGVAPASITVTAGANQITVDVTEPTSPTGWTIAEAVAAVIADQDPQSGVLYDVSAGSDNSSPYSIVITGLTTAQLYRAGAWLVWTKPDGTTAYSSALTGSATPT